MPIKLSVSASAVAAGVAAAAVAPVVDCCCCCTFPGHNSQTVLLLLLSVLFWEMASKLADYQLVSNLALVLVLAFSLFTVLVKFFYSPGGLSWGLWVGGKPVAFLPAPPRTWVGGIPAPGLDRLGIAHAHGRATRV